MIYISNMETGQIKRVKELPDYILPLGVCGRTSAVVLGSEDYDVVQRCSSTPEESYSALLVHLKNCQERERMNVVSELAYVLPDDWRGALQMRKIKDLFFFDEEDRWNTKEDVLVDLLRKDLSDCFRDSCNLS